MQKKIFATDLDRTLIYSRRFLTENEDVVCVERIGDKEISYMTPQAMELLKQVRGLTYFIPVTTRSYEQFRRVTVAQNTEWAICSNGGTILRNGEIYEPWEKELNERLDGKSFAGVLKSLSLERLCNMHGIDYSQIKLVDGRFHYIKLNNDVKDIFDQYLTANMPIGWTHVIQGVKLYIIPNEVTKEAALAYVIDQIFGKHFGDVITAGDGPMDLEFLKLGTSIYTPEDSFTDVTLDELGEHHDVYEDGFYGVEELLEEILEEI